MKARTPCAEESQERKDLVSCFFFLLLRYFERLTPLACYSCDRGGRAYLCLKTRSIYTNLFYS
ncbi:hypothetical protein OIU78_014714 [Salix suchowensis]|jgi:hypothetical protein|nr:hypothetical protein OIU78_014714 [Salix suchowensis]